MGRLRREEGKIRKTRNPHQEAKWFYCKRFVCFLFLYFDMQNLTSCTSVLKSPYLLACILMVVMVIELNNFGFLTVVFSKQGGSPGPSG